ncbi:Ribosomal protein S12 methylthiotransferase RimO [Austwickia sp. TVS 96-490-7B]|uniref:30S ribosomal protein S12 methylthiotransferase RimO n=1 Tax=Austwickia sp. TVS 96-490-7B TaxID=2830843 RepID=UPI001C55B643|nr:30S ribosomal protein S12 methylthiotransferase RimO [Austwickia sp. TVS 96-490-7B]MBW3086486.1 Ribosomal protein S12 methylthiotransferase RimO [Austwickia sp. TVS 96-490-7B]
MTSPGPQQASSAPTRGAVAIVTLGCARNDVDSEELAGRLHSHGWHLVDDPSDADVAIVNTCGFVEQAKKDSIDALLEVNDYKQTGRVQAVVAVGCMAERYGEELASSLEEADAVLGFDSYADMSSHLTDILRGHRPPSHIPRDRRQLLPLSPVDRQQAAPDVALPGHGSTVTTPSRPLTDDLPHPVTVNPVLRTRLNDRPWAPLKIASGCDRRCAFCAIPGFRGAFVSRRPEDILAEARWLAEDGVREIFLVSENSTSYGKDLGNLRALEELLPRLAEVDGIERIRVSYLQPAEIRPGLVETIAATPKVVPYYDLSFQHASESVLRGMRRFGSPEAFLDLIGRIRLFAPQAGIRSNVIVGFPGEHESDLDLLSDFLQEARLDVCGVFGYSDEEGTEAAGYVEKIDPGVVAERVERITTLTEELTAQRAEDRIGNAVDVLVEEIDPDGSVIGRAAHQGPEVDGHCVVVGASDLTLGRMVTGTVIASEGADLTVTVS